MILEITGSAPRTIKKLTWKQELKRSLYKKNQAEVITQERAISGVERHERKEAERSLALLFDKESISIRDKSHSNNCHAYYSTYIPLRMQSRFDDELTLTFPYIKQMIESGRTNDRTLLLIEISQFMKQSRGRGEIEAGWQKCLKKYLCDIDSIRAAQLYLQFKKFGTQRLSELHKQYGGSCTKQVFFQRVCNGASSFRKLHAPNRTAFSIQIHEQLNEVTMPKTMKQLFCCICLTYDCMQHALDDTLKEKEYQYVAPQNIVSEQENVRKAIAICNGYMQLLEKGAITGEPCSKGCFRSLGKTEWEHLQKNRARLLSPQVNGFIKLGIDMFSFQPCAIYFLMAQEDKVSCAHVFLFLVEEYGLMGRLQKKLLQSEALSLGREKQYEDRCLPQPPRKGRKRIKIAHTQHSQSVTSCVHYFRGEPPIDAQCESCACRERKYCLPQCLCGQNCPIRKKGCGCKKQDCRTLKCTCFNSNAECDPLICGSCFGSSLKKQCANHAIMNGQFKRVRVGRSTLPGAGLGLFAGEAVRKDDLLMIYSGELIDTSIDLLRESLSVDNTFYNFGSPQGTIDARFMGNLSRFINHADQGRQNLFSKNVLTQGRIKVAFYATREIEPEQELFFDYDGEGKLYKLYKEKYPFINDKKLPKE